MAWVSGANSVVVNAPSEGCNSQLEVEIPLALFARSDSGCRPLRNPHTASDTVTSSSRPQPATVYTAARTASALISSVDAA